MNRIILIPVNRGSANRRATVLVVDTAGSEQVNGDNHASPRNIISAEKYQHGDLKSLQLPASTCPPMKAFCRVTDSQCIWISNLYL